MNDSLCRTKSFFVTTLASYTTATGLDRSARFDTSLNSQTLLRQSSCLGTYFRYCSRTMSSESVRVGASSGSEIRFWLPRRASGSSSTDTKIDTKEGSGRSGDDTVATALCLGTGRFLRSVLVPAMIGAGLRPALVQTRGRNFMEYMEQISASSDPTSSETISYEVDTVQPDGTTVTNHVPCYGAFSLGNALDKGALVEWLRKLTNG